VNLERSLKLARAGGGGPAAAGRLIYFASGDFCMGAGKSETEYPQYWKNRSDEFDSYFENDPIHVQKVSCDSATNPLGNYWILPKERMGQISLAADQRLCISVKNLELVMKSCKGTKTRFLIAQGAGPLRVVTTDDEDDSVMNPLGFMPCVQHLNGKMTVLECAKKVQKEKVRAISGMDDDELNEFDKEYSLELEKKHDQEFLQRYTIGEICKQKNKNHCWTALPSEGEEKRYISILEYSPIKLVQFIFSTKDKFSTIRPVDDPGQCVTAIAPNSNQITVATYLNRITVEPCKPTGYNDNQLFAIKDGGNVIQLKHGNMSETGKSACVGIETWNLPLATFSYDTTFCKYEWIKGSYVLVYPRSNQLNSDDALLTNSFVPIIGSGNENLVLNHNSEFKLARPVAGNTIKIKKNIPFTIVVSGEDTFEVEIAAQNKRNYTYLSAHPDGNARTVIFKSLEEITESTWTVTIKRTEPAGRIWKYDTSGTTKCLEVQDHQEKDDDVLFSKLKSNQNYRTVIFNNCSNDGTSQRNLFHVPEPVDRASDLTQTIQWAGGNLDGYSASCLDSYYSKVSKKMELVVVPCKSAQGVVGLMTIKGSPMKLVYRKEGLSTEFVASDTADATGGHTMEQFGTSNTKIYYRASCRNYFNSPKPNCSIGEMNYWLTSYDCHQISHSSDQHVIAQLKKCTKKSDGTPCNIAETYICDDDPKIDDWTECHIGRAQSGSLKNCRVCHFAGKKCLRCDLDYTLDSLGQCVKKSRNEECKKYIPECKSCRDEHSNLCASCESPKVPSKDGNICVEQCMLKDSKCTSCDELTKKCLTCRDGYELDSASERCVPLGTDRCPKGHPYSHGSQKEFCCSTVRRNMCPEGDGRIQCPRSYCYDNHPNTCPDSHPKSVYNTTSNTSQCCLSKLYDETNCKPCEYSKCYNYDDPRAVDKFIDNGNLDLEFTPCSKECCFGYHVKVNECQSLDNSCTGLNSKHEWCFGDKTENADDHCFQSIPKCQEHDGFPETRQGTYGSKPCDHKKNLVGRIYRLCNRNGLWEPFPSVSTCELVRDTPKKNYCAEDNGYPRTQQGTEAHRNDPECTKGMRKGMRIRKCTIGTDTASPQWEEEGDCILESMETSCEFMSDFENTSAFSLPPWASERNYYDYCDSDPNKGHVVLAMDVTGQIMWWAQNDDLEKAKFFAKRECTSRVLEYFPSQNNWCNIAGLNRDTCPTYKNCAAEGDKCTCPSGRVKYGNKERGYSKTLSFNLHEKSEGGIKCDPDFFTDIPRPDSKALDQVRVCVCEEERPKVDCGNGITRHECPDCPAKQCDVDCEFINPTSTSTRRCGPKGKVDTSEVGLAQRLGYRTLTECRDPRCGEYEACCRGGEKNSPYCDGRGDVTKYSCIKFNSVLSWCFKMGRKFKPFREIDNQTKSMDSETVNGKVVSIEECQKKCKNKDKCLSFNFYTKKQECELFLSPNFYYMNNPIYHQLHDETGDHVMSGLADCTGPEQHGHTTPHQQTHTTPHQHPHPQTHKEDTIPHPTKPTFFDRTEEQKKAACRARYESGPGHWYLWTIYGYFACR